MSLQQQLGSLLSAGFTLDDDPQYVNVGSECHGHCGPNMDCTQCVTDGAPPEWQALDTPCETCDGEGAWWDALLLMRRTCPDCHGTGRTVRTIVVKRYPRHAGGMVAMDVVPGYDPRVTVSVDVTVRLVPVVPYDSPCSGSQHIVVSPDGTTHLHLSLIRGHQITVHGDPLTPSDWVAIIERIEP